MSDAESLCVSAAESPSMPLDRTSTAKQRQALCRQRRDMSESKEERTSRQNKCNERQAVCRQQHRQSRNCVVVDDVSPVDDTSKYNVLQACINGIKAAIDTIVCCVCDEIGRRSNAIQICLKDCDFLDVMSSALKFYDLPGDLKHAYDCSDIDPKLDGMMLSRKGIEVNDSDDSLTKLNFCVSCHKQLCNLHYVEGTVLKPPRFAIANGFAIGELPIYLQQATFAELLMCSQVSIIAQTRVLRGGEHRSLRSHMVVFDAVPGPPVTLLPQPLNSSSLYRVILCGPMTDSQVNRTRKQHTVRHSIVSKLMQFYLHNNKLYEGIVELNSPFLDSLPRDNEGSVPDSVIEIITDRRDEARAMDDQLTSLGLNAMDDDDEVPTIENSVIFSNSSVVPDSQTYELHSSSQFTNHFDADTMAKMFHYLFPYGRGHVGEARPVNVGKLECIRHYLRLSSQRFASDHVFILTQFDRAALEKGYTTSNVTCKANPQLHGKVNSITAAQLKEGLENAQRRRQGHTSRFDHINPNVQAFLKHVNFAETRVWASNSEARSHQRKLLSTYIRYGQAPLFITITPNSDKTMAIGWKCGKFDIDDMLDPEFQQQTMSYMTLKDIASRNVFGTAQLFDDYVNIFIEHVLAFDTVSKKSKPDGGLFGYTKAFYCMVETQGRGTLHLHCMVWLHGAPRTVQELRERQIKEDNYNAKVIKYCESVVTNTLPVNVADQICSTCLDPGSRYVSLPIQSYMQRTAYRRNRKDFVPSEPLLAKCIVCGTEASSQHLIRRAILNCWPSHWPPQLSSEQSQQRTEELKHELQGTDSLSNHFQNFSSDPFVTNFVTKNIMTMVPTQKDLEISDDAKKFIVMMIAYSCNMHSWAHCPSCFKESRNTHDSSSCRYRFPRPCLESSRIENATIELARPLGHQYVNGYNDVLAFAFRCNHDIQVMIGSPEMVERIFYACKYTTKDQQQVDSKVATAVASFDNRIRHEENPNQDGSQPSMADKCRRRLSSHLFRMTSKHEVADQLAALYLLRASRAYCSHSYVYLPLKDMLKHLLNRKDTRCRFERLNRESSMAPCDENDECNIVSDESESSSDESQIHTINPPQLPCQSSGDYVVLGPLADYLYRPDQFDDLSVYEFTMQCSRGKRTDSTNDDRLFKPQHTLHETCCVKKHIVPFIPVIPTSMYIPLFDDCKTVDDFDYHGQLSLLLLKPFRQLADLKAHDESWHQAWLRHSTSLSETCQEIYQQMQDYHIGRRLASDVRLTRLSEQDRAPIDNDDEDEAYNSDDLNLAQQDFDKPNNGQSDESDVEEPIDLAIDINGEDGDNILLSSDIRQPMLYPTTNTSQLEPHLVNTVEDLSILSFPATTLKSLYNIRQSNYADNMSQQAQCLTSSFNIHSLTQLRDWALPAKPAQTLKPLRESSTDDVDDMDEYDTLDEMPDASPWENIPRQTRLVAIQDAFNVRTMCFNPVQPNQCSNQIPLHDFPTISEVSSKYSLNRLQHAAFAACAKALLHTWLNRTDPVLDDASESDRNKYTEEHQLLMYLGGPGGTGKSHVISALIQFAKAWANPSAIAKTAMTGKAAVNIGGVTFHSWVGAHNLGKAGTVASGTVTSVPGCHDEMAMLFIDECSMMSQDLLLKLNAALIKYRKINLPFGGLHIVFVGDFMQLPPVGGRPLFAKPSTDNGEEYIVQKEAHELWRNLNAVIILTETQRFVSDTTWGEGCTKARLGIWSQEMKDMINSRLFIPEQHGISWNRQSYREEQQSMEAVFCGNEIEPPTFVTPDNDTRQALINSYTLQIGSMLPSNHFPIRVTARFLQTHRRSSKRRNNAEDNHDEYTTLQDLSIADRNFIMSMHDKKMEGLPPYIDIVSGLPITFNHNINVKLGISNGTPGIIVDFEFPASTTFRTVTDVGTNITCRYPSQLPSVVYVKVSGLSKRLHDLQIDPFPNLLEDIYPVFPIRSRKSVRVELSRSKTGQKRFVRFRMEQLPFVCAIASTTHKTQGDTKRFLTVANWKGHTKRGEQVGRKTLLAKHNNPQQAYIMVSRTINRAAFVTLEPFTDDHANYFRPGSDVLFEELRLVDSCNALLRTPAYQAMYSNAPIQVDANYCGMIHEAINSRAQGGHSSRKRK